MLKHSGLTCPDHARHDKGYNVGPRTFPGTLESVRDPFNGLLTYLGDHLRWSGNHRINMIIV